MKKSILVGLCTFLFFLVFVAAEPSAYYKKGDLIDLKIPCIINNSYCTNESQCNATVIYPNNTIFYNNEIMTYNKAYHNLTLSNSNKLGEYFVTIICFDNGNKGSTTFSFEITENGKFTNDWTFVMAIGIVVFIIFFFALKITNPEQVFLQVLLFIFGTLFSLLIPAYFMIINAKSIFYKTFMGLVTVLGLYVLVFLTYKWFEKMGLIVKRKKK